MKERELGQEMWSDFLEESEGRMKSGCGQNTLCPWKFSKNKNILRGTLESHGCVCVFVCVKYINIMTE